MIDPVEIHKKAESGDAHSQFTLAIMYIRPPSLDHPKDDKEAIKWLRMASDQDHQGACYLLADHLSRDEATPQDCEEVAALRLRNAERGDSNQQRELGLLYAKGKGVPQNWAEAYAWLSLASAGGDWAELYTKERDKIAKKMTAQQIEVGKKRFSELSVTIKPHYPEAPVSRKVDDASIIAKMIKDRSKASYIIEIRKKAETGDANAQFKLGMAYIRPPSPNHPKDEKEAIKWLRMASDQDHCGAHCHLAEMLSRGDATPQEYEEVATLRRRNAERGDGDEQSNLGRLYAKGQGVPQDWVEAYAWLSLASVGGEWADVHVMERDKIAEKMTSEQVELGKKRAKELYAKIKQQYPEDLASREANDERILLELIEALSKPPKVVAFLNTQDRNKNDAKPDTAS